MEVGDDSLSAGREPREMPIDPQHTLQLLYFDLHDCRVGARRLVPDIEKKLLSILGQFPRGFEAGDTKGSGAILLDRGVIVLDRGAIEMMWETISSLGEDAETEAALLVRAIELFAVHETLHISQGIARIDDVQLIKRVAPLDVLGQLDLVADHDAARFVAALHVARGGGEGRQRYLEELLTTQVMINQVAPQTFKAPADKPHKRHRFLGIALHAALLHRLLSTGRWMEFEERHFSLDEPIYPFVGVEVGQIVLTRIGSVSGPVVTIIQVLPSFLKELMDGLDTEKFATSFARVAKVIENIPFLADYGNSISEVG